MVYNLGYFSDSLVSPINHLSSQNLILSPHPTFHIVDLPSCCPCWVSWFIVLRSLHHKDSELALGAASRFLQPPYFESSIFVHISPWFCTISHFHFPNKDILNEVISLTPNPPSSFGQQTLSHRTQTIFFWSAVLLDLKRDQLSRGSILEGRKPLHGR